ncbi:Rid family hydrolase [Sediminicoccus sp. KRV36]|uniref:Rid family hydrolase n=1 Tax=Sediminicoccus sp. KRV36 TaxID=3133721 RepID=UPI00200BF5EC|nr:Rid family hydrolase [Sediminicoccus rosea]UPY35874.1 RidA family protein [Sediminicoccus rosea]
MTQRFPGSNPTRSRAVLHNGIVTTVATSPVKSDSMYEQTQGALAAITGALQAAGSSQAQILTAICYCADMSRKAELNQAWDEWVDRANIPMRAVLGVQLEGRDLIEIIATAAV